MAKGFKKAAGTIGGSDEPQNTSSVPAEAAEPIPEPTPAPTPEPIPAAPEYTPPAAEPTPEPIPAPAYTPPVYSSPVAAPAPPVSKRSRKGLVIAVIIALVAAILAVGAALYVFNVGGLKDTVNKFFGISSEPAATQTIDSEDKTSEPEERREEQENNGSENIINIDNDTMVIL